MIALLFVSSLCTAACSVALGQISPNVIPNDSRMKSSDFLCRFAERTQQTAIALPRQSPDSSFLALGYSLQVERIVALHTQAKDVPLLQQLPCLTWLDLGQTPVSQTADLENLRLGWHG